ncbi:MAG TPA: FtsX-like permease family protein [Firmicutes bacterium]|nr:FtsX-like permease family protein [Bacillota bacterium]
MKRAFWKDVFRQIRYSPRRFAAIFLIVALGVAFFAGIRSASPDMRLTVDRYFDDYNAADVRVLSTLGFDEDDLAALRGVEGVKAVQPGYTVDGFLQQGDNPLLVSFQSLDWRAAEENPDEAINRLVVVEGRLPQAEDECVIDEAMMEGFAMGDTVVVDTRDDPEIADSLSRTEYTVVGSVRSLDYISFDRGSSTKGSGNLSGFVFLPVENFTLEVYTQVYLQAEDTGYSRFSEEYEQAMEDFCDRLEAAGAVRNPVRYETLTADAQAELEDARQQLADGEQELADARRQLEDAEQEIADGERELADGREEFEEQMADGERQLADAKAQLDEAAAVLEENERELADGRAQLEQGRAELEENRAALQEGEAGLRQLQDGIGELEAQLALLPPESEPAQQLAAQLEILRATYEEKSAELEAGRSQLAAAEETLASAEARLEAGEAALAEGRAEYESGLREYQDSREAFARGRAEGEQELADAEKELADARQELADGWAEYNEKEPDALAQIEDARQQIADGEEALADLEEPEWFPLDLRMNAGFASYIQDTDRVAAIGLVFPLIFFLVAALVSLTNMTRMVEDDRTVIGVMKALGYGRMAIACKYLVYAGLATVGGIILGVAVGCSFFPWVVANAYGILYTLPSVLTPLNVENSLLAGGGALLCAVLPAFLVCQGELMSTPASLMRPRSPKEGKRILLERVGFIWKHINFSKKVTCRNIFRYKKRLLMTIFGVAGCTALIFTGFGLKDSIRMMIPKQYEKIQKYDMQVSLDSGATGVEKDALAAVLDRTEEIGRSVELHQEIADALSAQGRQEVYLVVPQDEGEFLQFMTLKNRRTGKDVSLPDEGAVITEKLGRLLDVGVGDTLTLRDGDNREAAVEITGIVENYVYHYVYMTPGAYESAFGASPEQNTVFAQLNDTSQETEDGLSRTLLDTGAVSGVAFNTAIRANFDDMISALDIVVVVLIFSAAALAFVVLFSLTSINIDERERELATLKVLGFYDGETAMYLYRENILLTLLGILAGLVLGNFLLFFVLNTAEVDMVMFTRETYWTNYVVSSVITFGFSVLVNLLTNRVIRKIDMVESLKSVE